MSSRHPERLLLGPGPSNVAPQVMQAISAPILGHLDPYFLEVMNDTSKLLKYVFQTKNKLTFPISGTGTSGIEAILTNIVEPKDEVIVLVTGYFGSRISDKISRIGGKPIIINSKLGSGITHEIVEDHLKNSNANLIALVQGETSAGVMQPVENIGKIAKKYDTLFFVDTVSSLGGCEFKMDAWNVDACSTGSQKCLGAFSGVAPISINSKAYEKIINRSSKVPSFYLDLSLIEKYWSENPVYHHTAPTSLIYALKEALSIIKNEGLENCWARHSESSKLLIKGIEKLNLNILADIKYRLPTLTGVKLPSSIPEQEIRSYLLNSHNIEVGGGLGENKGKLLRIGLMGYNANKNNVVKLLSTIESFMKTVKK